MSVVMSVVSAIIPCYNYGRFLRECVESVLSQEGVEVRVLILDDCSPDDTPEVGSRLAAEDSRVEYRRHAENKRHIATYNEGIEWANGDYTLLLSADDKLAPGALARATRLMDSHPDVGFVYGDYITLTEGEPEKPPRSLAPECEWTVWSGLEWLESVCRERNLFIVSPEVLVRTRMYKDYGGYRKELPHTADVEMWLRLASHGSVGRVEADQAYYRIHGKNMHESLSPTALHSLEHWNAAFRAFFDNGGAILPDGPRLEQLADLSLAAQALDAVYSRREKRDRGIRRELIAFAGQVFPPARTLRGKFQAGLSSHKTTAPWAKRAILRVPVYLFRCVLTEGLGSLRHACAGNPSGAAYQLGKTCAAARLIAGIWFGRAAARGETTLKPGHANSPA